MSDGGFLVISCSKALALGLKRYYTGRPCRFGHVAERATVNGSCLECRRLAQAKARKANPDKFRERDRVYARLHSEQNKARAKTWAENNRERKRATARRYYIEHPEKKSWRLHNVEQNRINKRNWRLKHKDEINAVARKKYPMRADRYRANAKKWRLNNKQKHNTANRNREARKKNSLGQHTYEDILRLFVEQNGLCTYCGKKLELTDYHVDHNIPLAKGGSNGSENICLCCPPCNLHKHTMTGEEYRALLKRKT